MKYLLSIFLVLISSSAFSEVKSEMNIDELKKLYERPSTVPFLDNNRYTKERELLGKKLFFDPRLSGSGVMSCATCHNPSFAWGDGLPKAVGHGHKVLGRRTPTILNLAWAPKLFWDGRAGSLEEQALGPIASEGEMNMPLPSMVKKIAKFYKADFEANYPGEPMDEILIGKAIAVYERNIISKDAPFDMWLKGDESAINSSAKAGFAIFNGKANCVSCHAGWNFTDHSFQDIGIDDKDIGRGKLLKLKSMQHAFKTPGLRNIKERAPYMHNGSLQTLEDVVRFYNVGGVARRESLSANMKPLHLSEGEIKNVVDFLHTLTSNDALQEVPVLPR